VQHPAVRMLVMAAEMQEKQIGDYSNTVVIFAAALLENALPLLDMGLKPVDIADGYELAYEKVAELLPGMVVKSADDLRDMEKVKGFLKSSIMSKQVNNSDLIADLVAKACVQIAPKQDSSAFNVDNIRVCKVLGAGVAASRLMNGMVFRRGAEGEVKEVTGAKVAVFACPFDLTQTETKGTVLMSTAEDLLKFSAGEEAEVERQVKALADAGVSVVVAGGKFGDLYLHFLNKHGIMGVRIMSKFDLRRLCRSLGAQAQARICVPSAQGLGQCDKVHVEEIGDTQVVIFEKSGEAGQIATVVVRGSSQVLMDDVERSIDDAVNTYKALTKDARLLPGAGAVEVELAMRVEEIGSRYESIHQTIFKSYASALETIPKQLAENSGTKSSEVLTLLHAAHKYGRASAGIDVISGEVVDADKSNIYDVFAGKALALKLATNAAATILKIDQIIMAKPAGGPAPRGPKGPMDADDD